MAGRKAGTKDQPVTIDWANAEVADAPLPTRLQKSIVDDTPFMGWYSDSWESSTGKQLSGLTEDGAAEAKRLAQLACYRTGRIWGGEFKTGIRHHTQQEEDGTFTYTFLAVDRTKAGEADAEAGEADPTE